MKIVSIVFQGPKIWPELAGDRGKSIWDLRHTRPKQHGLLQNGWIRLLHLQNQTKLM